MYGISAEFEFVANAPPGAQGKSYAILLICLLIDTLHERGAYLKWIFPLMREFLERFSDMSTEGSLD